MKRLLCYTTAAFLPALLFLAAQKKDPSIREEATAVLQSQIVTEAAWALSQQPMTVTYSHSSRSAGGLHDFFSEGDYWWPNPASPDSPYIQRDGQTNPENFVAHRQAMIRFSRVMGALGSAYLMTGDQKYLLHAGKHLRAWFVDTSTRMNPSLLYAQAIKGRFTGRGIGIIDGIQLMEVAKTMQLMEKSGKADAKLLADSKTWFRQFLQWLTTHQYGKDEMNASNNHGTCWVMQVAVFADLVRDTALLDFCAKRYREILLPNQMAANGSFPLELRRTKPYGYSIFNLDAMATICQTLKGAGYDCWRYQTTDGRSIKNGIEYLFPYVNDKGTWPLAPDVMYWSDWPVAQPFLLFGANTFGNRKWFETWKRLDHNPQTEEIIRNLPVRHPLIWLDAVDGSRKDAK